MQNKLKENFEYSSYNHEYKQCMWSLSNYELYIPEHFWSWVRNVHLKYKVDLYHMNKSIFIDNPLKMNIEFLETKHERNVEYIKKI